MLQSVGDIKDNIVSLQTASKGEPEKLAHEATKMANFFPILISASVGAASRTQSQQMQSSLLEQTKTLAEACMQMMYSAKQSGGNFKSIEAHAQVDEGARFMDDAAEELTKLLEKAGAEAGLITGTHVHVYACIYSVYIIHMPLLVSFLDLPYLHPAILPIHSSV